MILIDIIAVVMAAFSIAVLLWMAFLFAVAVGCSR